MRSQEHPDLSVSLTIGGATLEEYDDEAADDSVASRYVEATSGSHFAVKVEAHRRIAKDRQDCMSTYIYLDGKMVQGKVIYLGNHSLNTPLVKSFEGKDENTQTGVVLRRFTFAHLETNDGPVGNAKKHDFKDLGEVTVKCYWVRPGPQIPMKQHSNDYDPSSATSVPEKCLKGRAISNRATLGKAEVQNVPTLTYVDVTYPYGRAPFATFTFKYRSRRDLQIEGVIPRSPSPLPLEERDPETLSREEAIELLERRNRERQQLTQVKKEKRERPVSIDDDVDDDDLEIVEKRAKRRHVSDDSGVEIVDLTQE